MASAYIQNCKILVAETLRGLTILHKTNTSVTQDYLHQVSGSDILTDRIGFLPGYYLPVLQLPQMEPSNSYLDTEAAFQRCFSH